MNCQIAFEDLVDFVEGRLSPGERDSIQAHLDAGCERCADKVASLRRIIAAMTLDRGVEPSEEVVQRAVRLVRHPTAVYSPRKRLRAVLAFDSVHSTRAGARGGESYERRLLYRAADLDIDLHLQPLGCCDVALVGQLLPNRDTWDEVVDADVELKVNNRVVARGTANEVGEFVVSHLGASRYDVYISTRDYDIVVEGLEV